MYTCTLEHTAREMGIVTRDGSTLTGKLVLLLLLLPLTRGDHHSAVANLGSSKATAVTITTTISSFVEKENRRPL